MGDYKSIGGVLQLSGQGLSAMHVFGMSEVDARMPGRMTRACYGVAEERQESLYTAYRAVQSQSRARTAFTLEQCVAVKACTGAESADRFAMEPGETPRQWHGEDDTNPKKAGTVKRSK